jgi:hypothetical protein
MDKASIMMETRWETTMNQSNKVQGDGDNPKHLEKKLELEFWENPNSIQH